MQLTLLIKHKNAFILHFALMDYFGVLDVQHMIKETLSQKYNLEIKTVVKPENEKDSYTVDNEAYAEKGIIINSEFLNGLKAPEDSVRTIKILKKKLGKKINFRLKDGVCLTRY